MEAAELFAIVDKYYPAGIAFWEEGFESSPKVQAMRRLSVESKDDPRWKELLASLNFGYAVDDHSVAWQGEPGFVAILQPEEKWDISLFFKISLIAPVYMILFSNGTLLGKSKILRFEAITDEEAMNRLKLETEIKRLFKGYQEYHSGDYDLIAEKLGEMWVMKAPRKPFLEECIFGMQMSFHP